MKAIAKVRRERGIEVIDVPPDKITDNEVLVKMRSASVCGSDLGLYDFSSPYQKFTKVPIILGHEFSGEIVELGKKVSGYTIGQRVSSESVIYCDECRFCKIGMTNICQNFEVFGVHKNGGFAEFVSVDPKLLHNIPHEITCLEAGIVEPLSIAVNAVDDIADVRSGQCVSIIGPGPIGLLCAEVLSLKGVNNIFVLGLGVDTLRLEIARDKLGYRTINVEQEDPQETIMDATKGYGCELVIVAAGAAAALRSGLSLVSKGGQVVVLAIFPEEVPIPLTDLVRRQVSVTGSYASRWIHYEQAISLLRKKKVRADAIVTHRFELDQAERAFEIARSKVGCKVQFYA